MKRFRFSLQPVATLRDLQEMRARERFAAALGQVRAGEAALAAQQLCVAQFVTDLLERRGTALPGVLQVSFMRSYNQEVERERQATEVLARAEHEREAARKQWIDAHLQVKLVARLHEQARLRHVAEVSRLEQRQLDDRAPRGILFAES